VKAGLFWLQALYVIFYLSKQMCYFYNRCVLKTKQAHFAVPLKDVPWGESPSALLIFYNCYLVLVIRRS